MHISVAPSLCKAKKSPKKITFLCAEKTSDMIRVFFGAVFFPKHFLQIWACFLILNHQERFYGN